MNRKAHLYDAHGALLLITDEAQINKANAMTYFADVYPTWQTLIVFEETTIAWGAVPATWDALVRIQHRDGDVKYYQAR